jgi:bifunctional DNase/RNase
MEKDDMTLNLQEVRVVALLMDPVNHSPVVILRESSGPRILPIWIGEAEAWAIAVEMQGTKRERPMTHDLLKQTIESLKGRVSRIAVTELVANTFYALITIEQNGTQVSLDARPSDSIALALRFKAPIFVSDILLMEGAMPTGEEMSFQPKEPSPEDLRTQIKEMNPEDFGKFKM